MSGPHRNPDKINTIGIVVVGICGAVLVYVTIVALQAFYAGDTSEIQTLADYGGQDQPARSARVRQTGALNEPSKANALGANGTQTYQVPLDGAIKKIAEEIKANPKNVGNLVPGVGPSNKPTTKALFGRPVANTPAAPATPAAAPAGEGSAAAPPPSGDSAPLTPTGGTGPGGGTAPVKPDTAPGSAPTAPPPAAKPAATPAAKPAATPAAKPAATPAAKPATPAAQPKAGTH